MALIAAFLIWGLVGGQQVSDVGISCDFGIGDGEFLCWKWSKNTIGQIQDVFQNAGNVVRDTLDLN